MRFLRRNECKRHEANHLGTKPYECDICKAPNVKFARRDLLTRHMKRTHGIATMTDGRRCRKRMREVTPDDEDMEENYIIRKRRNPKRTSSESPEPQSSTLTLGPTF